VVAAADDRSAVPAAFNLNWDSAWEVRATSKRLVRGFEIIQTLRYSQAGPPVGCELQAHDPAAQDRPAERHCDSILMQVSLAGALTASTSRPAEPRARALRAEAGSAVRRAGDAKFFVTSVIDAKYGVTQLDARRDHQHGRAG
jgi:hypothetical protein